MDRFARGGELKPERLAVALPILIGVLAFLLVAGPRVLYPTNLAWLGQSDPTTHYLGWLFFRNSEWSFPAGMNPGYGLELGNSILFSDSNPLFAFLFKPFSGLLPKTFQYFGLWLLLCFILQAWFGWKLLGLISTDQALRALGAAFFVFSPPMIWRVHVHLSLAGHFLILAALYLSLRRGQRARPWAWAGLLVTAALVHAYLLAMVALLWLADLAAQAARSDASLGQTLVELFALLSSTAAACWQAGYFSVGDGLVAGGFGVYRMNLLSPVNPAGWSLAPGSWSYLLKDIAQGPGDYEGFNYLGLGGMALAVCALPALVGGRTAIGRTAVRFKSLIVALLALTLFAVSNRIAVGPHEFGYALPELALKAANAFRASGRMFWPVFYVVLLTLIYLVVRGYRKRTATVLMALALLVQIVDTHSGWAGIRRKLMSEPASSWPSALVDPFWDEAATRYARVRWIEPANHSPHWLTLAAYAGAHGLATDAVYLARVGASALEKAQSKAAEALRSGHYEADALYFLDPGVARQAASTLDPDSDVLARIDGFIVLAPGWTKCAGCRRLDHDVKPGDSVP